MSSNSVHLIILLESAGDPGGRQSRGLKVLTIFSGNQPHPDSLGHPPWSLSIDPVATEREGLIINNRYAPLTPPLRKSQRF